MVVEKDDITEAEIMGWADSFEKEINNPGWVSQFAMLGVTDPIQHVKDLGGTEEIWRRYNARVFSIIENAGKLKTLKRVVIMDRGTKSKSCPDCGRIMAFWYSDLLISSGFFEKKPDWF